MNDTKLLDPEVLPPDRGKLVPYDLPQKPDALAVLPELPVDDPLYGAAIAANQFIKASKSEATIRAYDSDWRHFETWCKGHGVSSLPATPETIALYISDMANPEPSSAAAMPEPSELLPEGEAKTAIPRKPAKVATIKRRVAAINAKHKREGYDSPAHMSNFKVSAALAGISRTLGTAQDAKKPLTLDKIQKIIDALEGPIAGARDKALILLGFVGGMRRSELAAIRVEHLQQHRKGYTIKIPRSKTDQEGRGREVEIPFGENERTCPVLALENWLKIANIHEGFVLRRVGLYGDIGYELDKDSIGRIIKRAAKRAGLRDVAAYGGHSLRAGFVTEASSNGASDRQIMRQTGHKSRAMIDRYSRAEQKDRLAAATKLGV